MTRTISSNEAKQRWGSVIQSVSEDGDRVVVESHGKAKVAVVSVKDLERLEALEQRERREEALTQLRALEERIGDRNADLTGEEVEEIAIRVGREINERVNQRYRAGLLDRSVTDSE